jgi:hypothetical protein
MAALMVLAATAVGAADGSGLITVDEYRGELLAIDAALAVSDFSGASARAGALRSARVSFGGESVPPDPALTSALASAGPGTVQAARARVGAVLRGLDRVEPAPPPADAALLQRARLAEQPAAVRAGGQVGGMPVTPSLPRRLLDAVVSAWRWVADAVDRVFRWLERSWPRRRRPAAEGGAGTAWAVGALVVGVAAAMAALAVAALRRSTPAGSVPSEAPAASERDADPLSREQDEWEAYAAELGAAGRAREAIRAWYNAVLVALFRAGALHHHKGRTNWEYVARVPPESSWRRELIALTRRFDREWYGSDRSAPDSLRECAAEARGILRQVREGAAP